MRRQWLYRLLFGELPETREKLVVEIEADASKFEETLTRIEKRVDRLSESLGRFGQAAKKEPPIADRLH